MSGEQLEAKLARMQDLLRSYGRVVVAFSAGVDSTFVLKVAVDTLGPENVVPAIGDSESLARSEFEAAKQYAADMGVELVTVEPREMDDPAYAANPADRCYHCKKTLYGLIRREVCEPRGIEVIACGINADDFGDWRPGIRAGSELGVVAPCADSGMTKADIRALSERMGLPTFDKPAMPCLASRVAYGEWITPEKLGMVEQAEAFLRQDLGLRDCRVRHHDKLARIEVAADQIVQLMQPETRQRIDARLREIGYTFVAMDMRGFRSGALNEAIGKAGG